MVKKIGAFFISFLFASALPLYGADFEKPVMPTFQELKAAYTSTESMEATLKQNATPEQNFIAGLFYFYQAVNVDFGPHLRKGIQKKYNERAIELFETANKMAPDNPYYL